MKEIKPSLEKILNLMGVFRLEKQKWPLHAAELQSFALGLGKSLDFSKFHRCRFLVKSNQELVLDFLLSPDSSDWAPRGAVEVRVPDTEREDTLPMEMEIKNLAPQKVETRSYCSVGSEESRKSA